MAWRKKPNYGNKEIKVETPDISDLIGFKIYALVWSNNLPNKPNISGNVRRLDRCCSVSHRIESVMFHFLVIRLGKIISKNKIQDCYKGRQFKYRV